jgi:flagellar biosynthesis protein FlhF
MPEAMEMVRAHLGDDAVIVASQRGENGQGVRVTAAVDPEDEPHLAPPVPVDLPLDALETISLAMDRHGVSPTMTERLLHAAMPYAERLVRAATALAVDAPVFTLAAAFDSLLAFEAPPGGKVGRPLVLIGPPGAGKTVTAAKIATAAVMRGASQVAVVSADGARAGGTEQLRAFTDILGVDLLIAGDRSELRDALAATTAPDRLVLVDTGGVNPFDGEDLADLARLLAGLPVDPILVVAAGGDGPDTGLVARAFAAIGARRLLPTRVDAARRLGSLIDAADEAGLAFCGLGATSRIADGLSPVNAVTLARLMLSDASPTARPIGSHPAQAASHQGNGQT